MAAQGGIGLAVIGRFGMGADNVGWVIGSSGILGRNSELESRMYGRVCNSSEVLVQMHQTNKQGVTFPAGLDATT